MKQRKFLSLVLAMALALSLAAPAFAEDAKIGDKVLPRGEMTLEPQDMIILHSDKIVK